MNRRFAMAAAVCAALAACAGAVSAEIAADTVAVVGIDLHNSPVDAVVRDSIAYVHFPGGLAVVDISSPRSPDSLALFDLPGQAGDIVMREDHIYLSRGDAGLFTYDISDPRQPQVVDTLLTDGRIGRMAVKGQRLFGLDETGMVSILLDPAPDPSVLNHFELAGAEDAVDFIVRDNVAYIAVGGVGIALLNVTNNIVTEHDEIELPGVVALELGGTKLYASTGTGGIVTVDVSDADALQFGADSYASNKTVRALALVDSLLVAVVGSGELGLFFADDLAAGPITVVAAERNPSRLIAHEGYALAMMEGGGLGIIDVVEPEGTSFLSLYDSGTRSFQSISLSGDTVFAAAGSDGVLVLSIENPLSLQSLGLIEMADTSFASDAVALDSVICVAEGGRGVGIYRRADLEEVARVRHVGSSISLLGKGTTLFVCYGTEGLLVVDLSDPANPAVTNTLAPGLTSGSIRRVRSEGDLLVSAEMVGGLGLIDISDPLAPERLSTWDNDYVVADADIDGDEAYALLTQAGLVSLDIGDPSSPAPLDTLLLDVVLLRALDVEAGFAYVLEWLGRDTTGVGRLIDVQNPASLGQVGEFITTGPPSDILVSDNRILVPEGNFGLEIFTSYEDYSAVPAGEYVQSDLITAVAATEQRMLTGDRDGTVRTFVIQAGGSLARRASIRIDGEVAEIAADDDVAFVLTAEGRIARLDVSNSFDIELIRYFDTPGSPKDLALVDSLLYVADAEEGLLVYDTSPVGGPELIGQFAQGPGGEPDLRGDRALRVQVEGGIAYVVTRSGVRSIYLIDVSDPTDPIYRSSYGNGNDESVPPDPGDRVFDAALYQGVAYLSMRINGLAVVDVSDPDNPFPIDEISSPSSSIRLEAADGILFVADRLKGVALLNISDPNNITELYRDDTPGSAKNVALFGTYLLVDDDSSIRVYLQSFANIDETAPTFSIAVLHSTFLNAYVDFMVVSSEVLDSLPVMRLELGETDSVLVSLTQDFARNIFHATYRLTGIGTGQVSVEGVDLAGNKTEAIKNFVVNVARGAVGGTITSENGKLELAVPPGAVSRDAYMTLVPVERGEPGMEGAPSMKAVEGPYRFTLRGAGKPAALTWSGIPTGEEGVEPVLYRLEGGKWLAQPAAYDAGTGTLRGELPGTATFLVSYDGGGSVPPPPLSIRLDPNRPNPFNPTTAIDYHLNRRAAVRLSIYDVAGRLVRTLVSGELPPGAGSAIWDGTDRNGRTSPSGVYFSRLESEKQIRTRKLILIR